MKSKNSTVGFLLCVFFGYLGLHELYNGKIGWFVAKLLTFNFFGIGWIVDIVRNVRGLFSSSDALKIQNANTKITDEYYDFKRKANLKRFSLTHDLSTVEAIERIPVPEYSRSNVSPSESEYDTAYCLQRKATEFKKSGRTDLAIACLKKSNELMLTPKAHWLKKDYLRYISYLENDGQYEKAAAELEVLKQRLPELFCGDKIFNSQISKVQTDLICFLGSSVCPYCSIYSRRIYSVSGTDKRFPPFSTFPDKLKVINCPECGCYLSFSAYRDIDTIETQKRISESNRPFTDLRATEQKQSFSLQKSEKNVTNRTAEEYRWISQNLPEMSPKSLSGYSRMKNAKSANYLKIVTAAKECGYDIKD